MPSSLSADVSQLEIVDAHHHLAPHGDTPYGPGELAADLAGQNVVATIYIESRVMLRRQGPEAMRPVGETEYAREVGNRSACGEFGPTAIAAAIVAHADLRLGETVGEVLDAHAAAADGRFRGIRQNGLWTRDDSVMSMLNPSSRAPQGLYSDPAFRRGFAELDARGLSFDALVFHPQLRDVDALAEAFPRTNIVLNHMGFPLGIGTASAGREAVFEEWRSSIQELAGRSNVFVKIGGMGMPFWGFDDRSDPDQNDAQTLTHMWRPYVDATIEAFGCNRCMLESNFPPDGNKLRYAAVWEAFRMLLQGRAEADRRALFSGTARSVYRL